MTTKILILCDICKSEIKDNFKSIMIFSKDKYGVDIKNTGYDMCNSCYEKIKPVLNKDDNIKTDMDITG